MEMIGRAATCDWSLPDPRNSISSRHGEISFARFKQELDMTDGNLGAQLRRLEDAGYLVLRRDFVERKPVTWYALSKPGRKALDKHLAALRAVIAASSA